MTDRRVCLFTGVSGTLGRDFVARYGHLYELVGVYHTTPPATPARELSASGHGPEGSSFAVSTDLTGDGAVEELGEKVIDRFGSVDVVVNAAVYRRFGDVTDLPFLESLDWQFYLNVVVPARLTAVLTRLAWRHTPEDNRRHRRNVVNLSSTAGHIVYAGRGQSGYAATKAALDTLTLHMAGELAPIGIRVNSVAPNTFPGLVPTESVSHAIVRFDQGDETGSILTIDTDGERMRRNT